MFVMMTMGYKGIWASITFLQHQHWLESWNRFQECVSLWLNNQLIGFREKNTWKSHDLHGKIWLVSCQLSLKSTHWNEGLSGDINNWDSTWFEKDIYCLPVVIYRHTSLLLKMGTSMNQLQLALIVEQWAQNLWWLMYCRRLSTIFGIISTQIK